MVVGGGVVDRATVRTARTAAVGVDDRTGVELARRVVVCTTLVFAGVALATFRVCVGEFFLADVFAPVGAVARRASGVVDPCGSPCKVTNAAPTATAPATAPTVAQDSDSLRRAIEGFSQRRVPRDSPSSAAQKATPPYRLVAT